MNRFIPDTWWDALWRPIAMAFPASHIYTEIIAPDLRFLVAFLLALAWLVARKRLGTLPRTVAMLLALVAASFAMWLPTSGNGRYYVPFLLVIGPLCAALIWHLPAARSARAAGIAGVLALQVFVVFDAGPWGNWSLTQWRGAPYYDAEIPRDVASTPATFVTITEISYSLVYPQFDPASHWINLSSLPHDAARSVETRRAKQLLQSSRSIFLLFPTSPGLVTPDLQPAAPLKSTIDDRLGAFGMARASGTKCRLMPSRARTSFDFDLRSRKSSDPVEENGFWLCPLVYPVEVPQKHFSPEAVAVFTRIENACPRLFPPGGGTTTQVADATVRHYFSSDMWLYAMNDGGVYYKYLRELNVERIGAAAQLLAGTFHMECPRVRGRSGLPWERAP
ncbi:MAG TPA: hypothetical protein VL593_04235 [Ramlibacter sp.]|nr:hypothetical protein [Ramlibacter sp.]